MTKFRMKADVTFEAEDLDDAFWLLKNHFHDLANGRDSKLFEAPSHVELKPTEEFE